MYVTGIFAFSFSEMIFVGNYNFYYNLCYKSNEHSIFLFAVSDTGIGSSLEEFQEMRVSFTNVADNWGR